MTLPAHFYRDPADVLESLQMRELGCRACASHIVVFDRVRCGDARNGNQKGVPEIGDRCKHFKGID